MAHYAITMKDGSVAIMQTIGDVTVEACLAKWHPDEQAKVVSHIEIDPADVPADRAFRNEWRLDGRKVAVNMELARVSHMADIRKRRDAALATKDGEWLVAFSRGDQAGADAIEAERQKLRDVPQTIDADIKAAATPEALKATWPEELASSRPVSRSRASAA